MVARSLLGQRLVRVLRGKRCSGRIVEVEAYLGPEDLASHTAGGRRTPRNESMYLGGGHAYVYLAYGLHHCFNVTVGRRGSGAAVLVRSLEPLEGIDSMQRRWSTSRSERDLCRGPGRLSKALGIKLVLDGIDLRCSDELWIEPMKRVPSSRVFTGPRIGLGQAGEWCDAPLRLGLRDCPFVSRPMPAGTVQEPQKGAK